MPSLIFACTAYGDDWTDDGKTKATSLHGAKKHKIDYKISRWSSSSEGTESNYRSLIRQMHDYVANGHASPSKTTMLYADSVALEELLDDSHGFDGRRDSLAMQLCGPDSDSQHVFGFMALNNGTFGADPTAFESWSNAECLKFGHATNFTATAQFTAPQLILQLF
ncbi:Peptidoglycan-binding Lysin subgroup [Penicillium canescens]|uniref:Peptidoglycan-binding Lysin subgroup n=1 Tax=Penicillium canescens TaxID=5083 RepID=A0AAD6IKU7_PENCN|nr:Peptidoglycan-binding Lysin subgroup [Penicillium canescens]